MLRDEGYGEDQFVIGHPVLEAAGSLGLDPRDSVDWNAATYCYELYNFAREYYGTAPDMYAHTEVISRFVSKHMSNVEHHAAQAGNYEAAIPLVDLYNELKANVEEIAQAPGELYLLLCMRAPQDLDTQMMWKVNVGHRAMRNRGEHMFSWSDGTFINSLLMFRRNESDKQLDSH